MGTTLHKPNLIVHADWGSNPKKQRMTKALLKENGRYYVMPPEPVGYPERLLQRLNQEVGSDGIVLIGFDFPIGLPLRYAELTNINKFIDLLPHLGKGRWKDFFIVAEDKEQISKTQPFYPYRPGGTSQKHLTKALEVCSIDELRRQCERKSGKGPAASPLFWTLGPKAVGKAAIIGWRDVIIPALSNQTIECKIWPYDGLLQELIKPGRVIIIETYPAEFYIHLGITFLSGHGGKRSQFARLGNKSRLFEFAQSLGIELDPLIMNKISSGFGLSSQGEDDFDATVGLFGMLNVLFGNQPEGVPPDAYVRTIEGWILGKQG